MIAGYDHVAVDVGAGDAHATIRRARNDPHTLAIAVEPSLDLFREGARTALRRRIGNALFVVASIQALPIELVGRADEVTITFPWGSLLTGIVRASPEVLVPLARLTKPGVCVRVLLSVEPRDTIATGLPALDLATLRANAAAYREVGFAIERCAVATQDEIVRSDSSWGKRIGHERHVISLVLRRA